MGVMGPNAGANGSLMEQWEMFMKKLIGKMMENEMDTDMGKMLGNIWSMVMGEDMGDLWEDKEDKEAMKAKIAMLMKKVTSVFRKVMMEIGGQMGGQMDGMGMEGNFPDMIEKILYMMEGGDMGGMMGGEDCCPYKKIWGSMNPMMDGVYTLVSRWAPNLPYNCMSSCVYEKKGSWGQKFCFAPSMMTQAQCIAGDGEEPVEMGYGSGTKPDGYGSGMKPNGSGNGMKPEGSGSGMKPSGSGMKPNGSGNGMKPEDSGSGMKPSGSGMKPEASGSGMKPNGSGSGSTS